MNHLAHFFLAERSPEAAAGAFLGDFVKGRISADEFPKQMCIEIMIHRHVDAFTDADAQLSTGKTMFVKTRRRFAGIALDVAVDHFLAKNWNDYTNEDLSEFARKIYADLESSANYFPANFREVLPRMINNDWLAAYRNFEHVNFALHRLAIRVRGGESLLDAFGEIKNNYAFYDELFADFFPRLQRFVVERRADLGGNL